MDSQSVQWTVTVTGHLRRQLNELTPNNQNNPPTQQQSRSKNDNTPKPWSSPESRARFEQRWSYSVRLARWQYFEGLLHQRTFLKWTLDTLAGSTSFEVLWLVLTGIIQDYIDEYKRNRTLSKILIEILIKSYSAVSES
jgi:hypothetical protein